MNIGLIILIVLFIAFILILVFNPNLSCFGKRLRSPFYPLRRRRLLADREKKEMKATDYGFHLVEGEESKGETTRAEKSDSSSINEISKMVREKGQVSGKKPKKNRGLWI